MGSQISTFSNFLVNPQTLNPNVQVVLFKETEFRKDKVKRVLKQKASGIVVLVEENGFSPCKKWMEAYNYLSTRK